MPFFMVDDQLTVNAKMRRLTEGTLFGDLRGMAAKGLWTDAGSLSQASGTDGLTSRVDCIRLLLNPALADELAGLLVDAGLWHAPGHTCPDCDPVPAEHYRFHQWWQMRYDPAAKVKATRAKRAELKDRDLRDAVWLRDSVDPALPTVAACRYCGKTVRKHDHTSEDAPHLDHVDPSKAAGAENLAVACGVCNKKKGQRTPAQAGMTLLPAPRPLVLPNAAVSPPQRAAETPQAPLAASPLSRAAEASQSHQQATERHQDARGPQGLAGRPQEDQRATTSQPEPRASHEPPQSALHGRTRAGGRTGAGGAGTGAGAGRGAGEGLGQPRSRRSRRRGRGNRSSGRAPAPTTDQHHDDPHLDTWDAGAAPEVISGGRYGSPWAGWSGPPGDDAPETRCSDHPGEHEPCRRCREET